MSLVRATRASMRSRRVSPAPTRSSRLTADSRGRVPAVPLGGSVPSVVRGASSDERARTGADGVVATAQLHDQRERVVA